MKRTFELFALWVIEHVAKLLEKLFVTAFVVFLYVFPIWVLLFENEGDLCDGICLFWIIVLYPSTLGSLIYNYYRHLICKYRDGKMPNNDFTRYMESD